MNFIRLIATLGLVSVAGPLANAGSIYNAVSDFLFPVIRTASGAISMIPAPERGC
jgi:hypothetical protein